MSLINLFKTEPSTLLRHKINGHIISVLQKNEMPWQKPWEGRGTGVGFPREISTKRKFFGINFLLLQMSAKSHGFVSSWWGSATQLADLGVNVKNRPNDVEPGSWATETIFYKKELDKIIPTSSILYNLDQSSILLDSYQPRVNYKPSFKLAERILHSTNAKIKYSESHEALYFYPPNDFIKFPEKRLFEAGIGGLPGYYESLAHELMHWSESRLGFDINCDEGIRELRADIGAAMLMEDLGVPHSISYSNFYKWRDRWINLLKSDCKLIFRICASASKGVEYIKQFSTNPKPEFNQINECLA